MKVLEVYGSFSPAAGGVQRHVYDLCKHLVNKGHTVIALDWENPGPTCEFVDGIIVQRFQTKYLSSRYLIILDLVREIKSFASKYEVDIIHAQGYLVGFVSAVVGLLLHKPVVITFHLPIWNVQRISTRIPPLRFLLSKFFLHSVTSAICVSKFTLAEISKLGFPRSKMSVIYNWIVPASHASDQTIIKSLGLAGKPFAMSVGRLDDTQKNFSGLIRVWRSLISNGTKEHLVIAGDGPDRAKLVKHIEEVGVKQFVHMPGHISDQQLTSLYKACDVFILPSHFEALPIVILEAMSYGKPVVATNVGGVPEIIKQGYNGILVDHSLRDLESRLTKLLDDRDLRIRLGEASMKTLQKRFSISNCDDTIDILEKSYGCAR